MKLFTRYNRINLLSNIIIFLVASAAFYVSLHYVLVHQIDEDLEIEETEITGFVREHNRLPENFSTDDQVIHFVPWSQPVNRRFTTVDIPGRKSSFRQLSFRLPVEGTPYKAIVLKSLEGTDGLLHSILRVSIGTILLILLVSVLTNRVLFKRLWQPFYRSLQAVQNFRPSTGGDLLLPPTAIDEFRAMNATLETITQASRTDYLALKTFSENASHEIQTPIAIIRSKLDLLIQDEDLTEGQSRTVQSAYNAVEKLSRLNGTLLLLARIENRQFEEVTAVDLKKKLQEKMEDFGELWQARALTVDVQLAAVVVHMNSELADILLNNLLSNAVNHNYEGGRLFIVLSDDGLCISNTSNEAPLDKPKLFQRFYKSAAHNGSNGLGLSLVKQIADASGFSIAYQFDEGLHRFRVQFMGKHPDTRQASPFTRQN